MTTSGNKNKWDDRLKTADSAFVSDILHNFGLAGGPSLKDIPYLGLGGLAAGALSEKLKDRKEQRQQNNPDDNRNVNDFSDDMSKMRDILDQRKTDKTPPRNHPSVPGFNPDSRSPYGVFDYNEKGYSGGLPPDSNVNNISDISEHPRFNSGDQGKSQRGRPFDREEE